jgi:hypothetical protein
MEGAPPALDINANGQWVVRDSGALASIQVRLKTNRQVLQGKTLQLAVSCLAGADSDALCVIGNTCATAALCSCRTAARCRMAWPWHWREG